MRAMMWTLTTARRSLTLGEAEECARAREKETEGETETETEMEKERERERGDDMMGGGMI